MRRPSTASCPVTNTPKQRSPPRCKIFRRCTSPRDPRPGAHPARPVHAVVFDCDGTLLETESRWTLAEQNLCMRHGVPFTMELKHRLLGTHLARSGEILADWFDLPPDSAPRLATEFIEAYRDVVEEHGVEPMPGAAELVDALADRVPLVVASNTHVDDTRRVLAYSSLPDDAFVAVVCAGGELAPKPAPDVYLAACAAVAVTPAASVAIEDSPVGAQAARAAGLFVYGVPAPGVTLEVDVVLGSLAELNAAHLI